MSSPSIAEQGANFSPVGGLTSLNRDAAPPRARGGVPQQDEARECGDTGFGYVGERRLRPNQAAPPRVAMSASAPATGKRQC